MVVEDDEKDEVVSIIMQASMTGEKGNPGENCR